MLAGPAAYSVTTLGSVTGTLATAGSSLGALVAGNAKVSQRLVDYLERHQGSAAYLVAVNGSVTAAPFILQSGKPVMAMGGFTDTDPAPTVTEFERLVATGRVHEVYIPKGTVTFGSGMTSTEAVDAWVEKHGTVGGRQPPTAAAGRAMTLYDVTSVDRHTMTRCRLGIPALLLGPFQASWKDGARRMSTQAGGRAMCVRHHGCAGRTDNIYPGHNFL